LKVLIAGGAGFLGRVLTAKLHSAGHDVTVLTRWKTKLPWAVAWDGSTAGAWTERLAEADAVVNATGYGLNHWPWTVAMRRRFIDSRVVPGRTLVDAILAARSRPRVFVQFSGVNHYGVSAATPADESTPAGDDFLARLTVDWEEPSELLVEAGVRRVVTRTAVVLAPTGGLFSLLAFPTRAFLGGRLGDGSQILPWIHAHDLVRAALYLLERPDADGVFNLVAPQVTSNAAFMRSLANVLHRPYWFHVPAILMRLVLGGMAVTVLEGRPCVPRRLLGLGFQFSYPTIEDALLDLTSA
jgi:uncharacterized protein (TIGR01777 family)